MQIGLTLSVVTITSPPDCPVSDLPLPLPPLPFPLVADLPPTETPLPLFAAEPVATQGEIQASANCVLGDLLLPLPIVEFALPPLEPLMGAP